MSTPASATEVSLLFIALIQGVFAVLWAAGASLVSVKRPLIYWAAWSALSCATWLTLSLTLQSPPLLGVLIGVCAVIALERGVCEFTGSEVRDRQHAVLLIAVIAVHTLPVLNQRLDLQAGVNYGTLAWLYCNVSRDLLAYARATLQSRWSALLAASVVIASAIAATRALRALADPDSVATVMATDSALNVHTAFIAVALVLTLHATLVALVVVRLVTELQRLSRHDALTGLLNRRAMEEALDAQMQRCRRIHAPFVVMMLDLDHFKRINDKHGHPFGDRALRHVAQLLKGAVREADRLARFGGEEFVLLLPDTGFAEAETIAEQLRRLLETSPVANETDSVVVSVSIGIAQWNNAHEDISRLLSRADAALFQAKVQGRNRVVTAMDVVAVAGRA